MKTLKRYLSWQIVALASAFLASVVLISIFASPESQAILFAADGLLATVVAYLMRAPKDRPRG